MKKENINNFVKEIWDNIFREGMETVLYKDGDNWTRQQGSKGVDEEYIVYKLPLSLDYWGDSYFMSLDEDGDLMKDESMKKDFIEDMTSQVREELGL